MSVNMKLATKLISTGKTVADAFYLQVALGRIDAGYTICSESQKKRQITLQYSAVF
jgi:hypothetical protein